MEKWITTTDQTKIYYEIKGQGPALIFLHGNSQTGRVFQKQVAYFSNFYTCITVDTRAHGKSFFEGERLTFQKLADDVIEIINHEKIETAYLLGFSDGANIAMILAAQEPQRFSKLILNAGNLTTKGLYWLMRLFIFLILVGSRFLRLNIPSLQLLVEDTGLDEKDLTRITAKTLVLVGQFDVVKVTHALEIQNAIPDAELIVAPLATHLFFYFQPKRFNKLIKQFLE